MLFMAMTYFKLCLKEKKINKNITPKNSLHPCKLFLYCEFFRLAMICSKQMEHLKNCEWWTKAVETVGKVTFINDVKGI